MHLTEHLFLSWLLPWRALPERRDRILVALAGIAPDIDAPILFVMGGKQAFIEYHHRYTHHFAGAALAAGAGLAFGKSRWKAAGFATLAWCGHLLLDLVGAGELNEDGTCAYPLPLLWPFSARPFDTFPFAWPLASWQNAVVMVFAMALMVVTALRANRTVVEVVSLRADGAVVGVLRKWFGGKGAASGGG